MKQKERLEKIMDEIETNGQVKVTELAEQLGISQVSIRNDIRKLDEEGKLKKTYGGAVKKEIGLNVQFLSGDFYLNGNKKQRIAEKAYEYIEEGDSVMLDDSSTCCYLAQVISRHPEKKMAIVTNSIYAAAQLSSCDYVDLYVLGGHVISNPPSVIDTVTSDNIKTYHVKKLFTGIHGIDLQSGLNSTDAVHMEVKKKMIECAEQVFVLADHTKFGSSGLFIVCRLEDIDYLITDSGIPKEVENSIRETGVLLDIL